MLKPLVPHGELRAPLARGAHWELLSSNAVPGRCSMMRVGSWVMLAAAAAMQVAWIDDGDGPLPVGEASAMSVAEPLDGEEFSESSASGDGDQDSAVKVADDPPYKVGRYDIDIDFRSDTIKVTATLELEHDSGCLTIPMRTEPIKITIGEGSDAILLSSESEPSVHVSGIALDVCRSSGDLFTAGSKVVLAVESLLPGSQSAGSDVGFLSKYDVGGGIVTYLLSWVEGCDLFGPCDRRPDQFAEYHFVVTHVNDIQVLCPGRIEALSIERVPPGEFGPLREGDVQTACNFDYQGPSYSTFSLVARSPMWNEASLGSWRGVEAQRFSYSESFAKLFERSTIGAAFEWLVDELGRFPYGYELRFIEAPTEWFGFEHPGNIVLKEAPAAQDEFSWYIEDRHHTVLHEIAHQWAGNKVTLASARDFAWKEAASEYLAFVFEDQEMRADEEEVKPKAADAIVHPPSLVATGTASYWKGSGLNALHYPAPEEPWLALTDFYLDAYGAGTMTMFRQLEVMFGREPVLSAIKAVLKDGVRTSVGVADFQEALDSAIEPDLSHYFQTWVYGSGRPRFPSASVSFKQVDDGASGVDDEAWEVQVKMMMPEASEMPEQPELQEYVETQAYPCAFHVELYRNAGDKQPTAVLFFNNGADAGEYAPQEVAFEPARFEVDPYSECLVKRFGVDTAAPTYAPRTLPGRWSTTP